MPKYVVNYYSRGAAHQYSTYADSHYEAAQKARKNCSMDACGSIEQISSNRYKRNYDTLGSWSKLPGNLISGILAGFLVVPAINVLQWVGFIPKETQPDTTPAPKVIETTQRNNTEVVETYPNFQNTPIQKSVEVDSTISEFFNTSYQEEAIDDLGQDWDK